MTGLVLEGGGMRGIFTAGVIDSFLEHGLVFDTCLAVSAGACHACSFLAGQRGRAADVVLNYRNDRHYCSFFNLITTGNLFGTEFLYDLIPNTLYPIDNDAFLNSKTNFYVSVTNCITGNAEYLQVTDFKKDIDFIRASSSLPLLSTMVNIGGTPYLDGGVSDSIPLKKSIEMGNERNVVVLTRHKGYRKIPGRFLALAKTRYHRYPALIHAIETRYKRYNETLDFIEQEERRGSVFVIRPPEPLAISRTEKNIQKLKQAEQIGYNEVGRLYAQLEKFIKG